MVKGLVVPSGAKPRRVRAGLYRDLVLEIDLRSQSQLMLGLAERETFPWIRIAATRCRWAVDVGAGSGELIAFLLRHSDAARVYGFEPDAMAFGLACRNLELNGLAASDRLVLSNSSVATGDGGASCALDALELDRGRNGFVKIDVDGSEVDVLKSGERLLREGRVDVLVETHSADLERECVDYLAAHGYACHIIDNAPWRLLVPELRPLPHCRWLWASKG
jgi:FkbM family methyltransferase